LGKHSAEQEPDGYGWFSGDLADDMPTQILQTVDECPFPRRWAEPTQELLQQLLEALQRNL
jgi:hypothetical protein